MVGYSKEVIWDYRHQYWLWAPILGPITGGLTATALYDLFVYTGEDSIFNRPNAAARIVGKRRAPGAGGSTHDVV
jgi:aquaglyceroporin related protein, other eukaryote